MSTRKTTVSNLSQHPSPSSRPTDRNNPDNQELRYPFQDFICSQRTNQPKIDLEKWKINFDGTGNVEDFIFKLDTLVERTHCCQEELEASFQIFLSRKAEKWYWEFVKRNNDPPFRLSLLKEFAMVESNDQLLLKLYSRRQLPRESYDEYHLAILAISYNIKESPSEERLVNILRKNVSSEIKFMLFNAEASDLHSFRDVARKAETIMKETKQLNPIKTIGRQVHELDLESSQVNKVDSEEDPQIETI